MRNSPEFGFASLEAELNLKRMKDISRGYSTVWSSMIALLARCDVRLVPLTAMTKRRVRGFHSVLLRALNGSSSNFKYPSDEWSRDVGLSVDVHANNFPVWYGAEPFPKEESFPFPLPGRLIVTQPPPPRVIYE